MMHAASPILWISHSVIALDAHGYNRFEKSSPLVALLNILQTRTSADSPITEHRMLWDFIVWNTKTQEIEPRMDLVEHPFLYFYAHFYNTKKWYQTIA